MQTATDRLTRYLRVDSKAALHALCLGAGQELRAECKRQGLTTDHLATITGTRAGRWEEVFGGRCGLEWIALGFAIVGYDLGITARPRAGHDVRSAAQAAERLSSDVAQREGRKIAGAVFKRASGYGRRRGRHSSPGGSSSGGGA